METWSTGKAVLQGMGLEMARDLLFFDLPVALFEKKKKKRVLDQKIRDKCDHFK